MTSSGLSVSGLLVSVTSGISLRSELVLKPIVLFVTMVLTLWPIPICYLKGVKVMIIVVLLYHCSGQLYLKGWPHFIIILFWLVQYTKYNVMLWNAESEPVCAWFVIYWLRSHAAISAINTIPSTVRLSTAFLTRNNTHNTIDRPIPSLPLFPPPPGIWLATGHRCRTWVSITDTLSHHPTLHAHCGPAISLHLSSF